jgi:hypothetical protein
MRFSTQVMTAITPNTTARPSAIFSTPPVGDTATASAALVKPGKEKKLKASKFGKIFIGDFSMFFLSEFKSS